MNRFTKRVLILAVFVLCLFGLTILGASAASTDGFADDAAAIEAGKVARVGGTATSNEGATYYATFEEAVSAINADNNVLYLIKSCTTTKTIASADADGKVGVACSFTLTSIDPENVKLTVGTAWLFDLGSGSSRVPTLENITIDVGSKNLGYFNNVKVIINAGTTITGAGASETYGMIYAHGGANTITVNGGTFKPTGSNPVFGIKDGEVIINGGDFQTGYWVYGKDTAKLTINGGTFTMADSSAASKFRGIFLYGANSTFTMTGGTFNVTRANSDNIIRVDGAATFSGGSVITNTAEGALGNNVIRTAATVTFSGTFLLESNYVGGALYIASGTTTINGGTFKGHGTGVVILGPITINGGTFTHDGSHYIIKESGATNITITGGTFTHSSSGSIIYGDSNSTTGVATVSGGTFTHTGTGSIVYVAGKNTATQPGYTVNVSGTAKMEHTGASGYIFYRGAGNYNVDGAGVQLIAHNEVYIFEQGYTNNGCIIKGAYLYTERADGSICKSEGNYLTLVNVKAASDAAAKAMTAAGVSGAIFKARVGAVEGQGYYFLGSNGSGTNEMKLETVVATGNYNCKFAQADGFTVYVTTLGDAIANAADGAEIYVGTSTTATLICLADKTLTVYSDDAADVAAAAAAAGAPIKMVDAESNVKFLANLNIAFAEVSDGAKIYNVGATDASTATPVSISGMTFTLYSDEAINLEDYLNYVAEYNGVKYLTLEAADAAAKADGKNYRIGNHMPTYYNNVADALAAAEDGATIYSVDGAELQTSFTVSGKTVTCYYAAANQAEINAIHAESGKAAVVDGVYYETAEEAFAAATDGKPVTLFATRADEAAIAAGYALRVNAGDGATYYTSIVAACAGAASGDTIYVIADFAATTEGSTGAKTLTISGVQKADGTWPVISATASNCFNVQAGADVTVKNLTINGTTTGYIAYATGKVTFENVAFNVNKASGRAFDTAAGSEIVFGAGTVITVEACASNLVNINGICTVKEGASILIKAIGNNPFRISHANAVLNIEGGDLKHVGSANGLVYAPSGAMNMTGGSITQTGAMHIVQAENCAITISGGTITHTGASNAIIQASGGTVTVSGTAKLVRTGATANYGYVFNMSGTSALTISGGDIYLNDTTSKASFMAQFTGTASFAMSGGTITASGVSNNMFLWNGTSHAATFTGGTLNCASTGNEALKLNAATTVTMTNVVINGLGNSVFYIPTSAHCDITIGAGVQVNMYKNAFMLNYGDDVNLVIDGMSVVVNEGAGSFINPKGGWTVTVKDINFYSYVAQPVIKATGGNVLIEGGKFEFAETPTYAAGAYIVSMDATLGTVNIEGGEFICRSGANAAVYGNGSQVVVNIYGGYFENNGESVLLVNGGATLNVYTATVVLQPSHKALGSNAAYAVIRCSRDNGVSYVNLMGGIYINNNDADATGAAGGCSNSVIYKNSKNSTVNITGGIFLVTGRQDYFFKTAGNANGATSNPLNNIAVIKNEMVKMKWGGREYYCMSFNTGAPVAPVVGSNVQIRLVENSTGLLFTSVLEADLYDAMLTWFGNAPAGSELQFGTVIATLNKVTTVGKFTMEAFDEAGFVYLNIPATATGAKVDAAGNLVINAAMVNLRDGYYDTVFTAVPYATIVTPATDDVDPIYYGAYNTNSTAASMSYLAQLALADNEATRSNEYDYKSLTVKNAYNRYTRAQQEILQSYLAHEHAYDYKGYCADCETGAAVELALGNTVKVYAEYETVNYYQLTLAENVSYRISFANTLGIYKLYDAEGNLCKVTDDIFSCKTAGTYYLVFFATRVGTTDLYVEHIHNADYKGYCSVCEDPNLLVELTMDSAYNLLLVKGNNYYYHIEMTAGVQYMVLTMNAEYVIYNADGNKCTVKESVFSCTATGDYYIVATATISAKGSAKVEHLHSYDFKGDCSVESCDATVAQSISGVFYENAVKPACVKDSVLYYGIELEAGKTYTVNVKGIISTYAVYNGEGQRIALDNKNSFACETSGTYYLVVNVQSTATAEIYMTYVHDCAYDHTGTCTICHESIATDVEVGKTETADLRAEKTYFFAFNGNLPAATYKLELPEGVTNFTLCLADGTPITVTEGSFVMDAAYDQGVFLKIVMGSERSYGTIKLQHVHEYGFDGYCTIENCSVSVRTALTADNPKAIEYENVGEKHYYRINLNEGNSYTVSFVDANATWELFDEQGTSVATSGEYACTASGYYYLVVTVTEASSSVDATITVASVSAEPAPVPGA